MGGEKGGSEANRESEGDGGKGRWGERWDGGMEQGGGSSSSSGLKMMIHPDPSECCHVPPSR